MATRVQYQLVRSDGANWTVGEGDRLSLGRSRQNVVQIADSAVSRVHATLLVARGRCWIRDENSTHGTLVNGQRVMGQQELRLGDELRIGPAVFHLERVAVEARGAPLPQRQRRLVTWGAVGAVVIIAVIGIALVAGGGTGEPIPTTSPGPQFDLEKGGAAEIADNVFVEVPPHAHPDGGSMSIFAQKVESPPPLPKSAEGVLVSDVYDFQPEGAEFAKPITITMPYDPNLLPPAINEEALVVVSYDGDEWASDPNSQVIAYDRSARQVTIITTHFSPRGIGASTRQETDPAETQFNKAFRIWNSPIGDWQLAIQEFQKVVDEYPDSPWAIRSLWFLGDLYAKTWIFGPQYWEGRDFQAYRDNLEKFDRALELWDEFLLAPDQGPGPFFSNPTKYPQHEDVQREWANYVPYGLEVYRYLKGLHWFDGRGSYSDPLPIMATTRIIWTERDDQFDSYYSAFMSPDELPETIRQDIKRELEKFGVDEPSSLSVVKQVASVEYIKVPAMVDALVSVYKVLKIPIEFAMDWIVGIEEMIHFSADRYVAKLDIDPEERESLHGGIYVAHVGINGVLRAGSDGWFLVGDMVLEGLEQLESEYLADVSFEDLPRGRPYPFLSFANPVSGRPAFVIVYQLTVWNDDGSAELQLRKHWVLQNVNAGEMPDDDDPKDEITPNFHEDDKNWEEFLVDHTVVTFPMLRFSENGFPEAIEVTADTESTLDLAVEYKLDRSTDEEPDNGLLLIDIQSDEGTGRFETLLKYKTTVLKTPYSETDGMLSGRWKETLSALVPEDAQAVRVCLELYDDPGMSNPAVRRICSQPILAYTDTSRPSPTATPTFTPTPTPTPEANLVPIPNVVGLTPDEAERKLKEAGFDVLPGKDGYSNDVPMGHIYKQAPGAGELYDPKNTVVMIYRSLGSPSPTVPAQPEGGKIAFVKGSDLWIMNPDGGGQQQVTSGVRVSFRPSWSPDGTRITFSALPDIYLVNVDGSNLVKLTQRSTDCAAGDPSWSPDGRKIVFVDYCPMGKIAVMNIDGSNQATLADGGFPVWSPDGNRIAFWAPEGLSIMNADGSGVTSIVDDNVYYSSWSPDGTRLAYSGFEGVISTIGTDGSGLVKLVEGIAPTWSPDGTKIAFGMDKVYVMNADGTSLHEIATGGYPSWSPR